MYLRLTAGNTSSMLSDARSESYSYIVPKSTATVVHMNSYLIGSLANDNDNDDISQVIYVYRR